MRQVTIVEALANMDNEHLINQIESMIDDGFVESQAVSDAAIEFIGELYRQKICFENNEPTWSDEEIEKYVLDYWTDSRRAIIQTHIDEYGLDTNDVYVVEFNDPCDICIWESEEAFLTDMNGTHMIGRIHLTPIEAGLLKELVHVNLE